MPLGNDKLLDQIFNLKFTSKQLVKSSSKCEKEEKTEKLKVITHTSPFSTLDTPDTFRAFEQSY